MGNARFSDDFKRDAVHPLSGSGLPANHEKKITVNETLFTTLADAKETLREWKDDYNQQRPHSSLGNLTPQEFAEKKPLDKLAA